MHKPPHRAKSSSRPHPTGHQPFHKTSWERVSDWYADYLAQPGTIQADVVFPNTERLLGLPQHAHVLDIACGEGSFTRLLAKHHLQVTGLDASPSLIEKAKAQAPRGSTYLHADANTFAALLPGKTFDAATCILAVQNIEHAERMFQQASKILKPNAPLIIILNHPSFRQPRQSGWGWDEERRLQYRRVDRYLNNYEQPIIAHPGSAPDVKTFSYHRPLSWYVTALTKAGFLIDGLEEWISNKTSDSGPRAKAENVARVEIPLFMAIRARKLK